MFARIIYGARVSLLVGFLSALVAVVLGTVLGVLAGYFGGWVDAVISRVMDGLLAFPQLLFIIALVSVMPNEMLGLTGTGVRIFVMILVIGFFGWPYVGRVVRGQTLSLREREYVEAARSLGAGRLYILFKELLPNLVAPIIVYTTMMIPTNILTEAALSFLGVGVKPPTASWGQMLSTRDRLLRLGPDVHGRSRAWRSSSPCLPSTSSATACAMRSTRRVPAELPYPQGPSSVDGPLHTRRIRVTTQRTTGRRKQAVAAAAVVAALLSTAACGGGGTRRRRRRRRGRLRRREQQGRAGIRGQEGRRAEVRRRPGRRLVGHHARLLRLRVELHRATTAARW